MKNLLFLFLLLTVSLQIIAQDKKTVTDDKNGKSMLIGKICVDDFKDTAFVDWWNSSYNNYTPDSATVGQLKGKLEDVSIAIVLATWCSDSRREVPRFYNILNRLNYPVEKINLICVDRKKQGVNNETEGLNIELVPTFIFYKNNKEIGRIIETPKESLEKDLLGIVE